MIKENWNREALNFKIFTIQRKPYEIKKENSYENIFKIDKIRIKFDNKKTSKCKN